MHENTQNDDLLIRYLDGELSAEERTRLEERLRTDAALQQELINLQVAVQAVKHLGTTKQVQAVHAEMMKELKAPKAKVFPFSRNVRFVLLVAASLVVLFIGLKLYQASQLSPDKLYSQTFVDFNVSASRGSGGQLSPVETLYQQKKYNEVTTSVRSFNLNAEDSLLIGLSYLQTDRPAQAIGFLQNLASTANDYQQDAEFYLALSYLKVKAYDKAVPLMERIRSNPSHLYHEQLSDDVVEKVKKLRSK